MKRLLTALAVGLFSVGLLSCDLSKADPRPSKEESQRQIDETKRKMDTQNSLYKAMGVANVDAADQLTLDRLQKQMADEYPSPTITPAPLQLASTTPTPDPWDNPEFKNLLKPRTDAEKKEEEAQKKIDDAQRKADQIKHAYGSDDNLKVINVHWRKGGFDTVSIITVTLKNVSKSPITNIRYETVYTAENGDVVTKGGTHEFLGVKDVKKVIAPGQTRTIEIDDGFIGSEAISMSFKIVGYQSR